MNLFNHWQPSCDIASLKNRALLLTKIRNFFAAKNVLEVETPILARTTIPDPHIASLKTSIFGNTYYLQTSPEFHMKRLLAFGSGSIFQICKSFRADELGRLHNPEFTMLEWYRVGFNTQQLLAEIDELLNLILGSLPAKKFSYQEIFEKFLQIDPLSASVSELQHIADINEVIVQGLELTDKDGWLNLLMSHCIEPKLNEPNQPYFIYDFPLSQAALAKQSEIDVRVAERFEVYIDGIELANGFYELTDAKEQRQRFQTYLQQRQNLNLELVPMPESFLEALAQGLPNCSGVALGIDRLLMIANQAKNLQEIMAFSADIA